MFADPVDDSEPEDSERPGVEAGEAGGVVPFGEDPAGFDELGGEVFPLVVGEGELDAGAVDDLRAELLDIRDVVERELGSEHDSSLERATVTAASLRVGRPASDKEQWGDYPDREGCQ